MEYNNLENLEEIESFKKSSDNVYLSQISPKINPNSLNISKSFAKISEVVNLPIEISKKHHIIPIFNKNSHKKPNEIEWIKISIDNLGLISEKNLDDQFIEGNYFENISMPSVFNILSLRPELLSRIFMENNQDFVIFLCDKGKWCKIHVDDFFPSLEDRYPFTNTIHNDHPRKYIMILEKALAAFEGNYENLFTSRLKRIVKLVIGVPIEKVNIDSDLRSHIENCFYRGFVIYFHSTIEEFKKNSFGLLDISENEGIKKYKIKVANKLVKSKFLNILGGNDQQLAFESLSNQFTFWIDFETLKQFLPKAYICKFHDNYYHTWFELKKSQTVLGFSCQINQHLYISVSTTQKINSRFFLIKKISHNNDENNIEVIKASYSKKSNNDFEDYFEPGEYTILIEFESEPKGSISLYSANISLMLQEINHQIHDFTNLQESVFKRIAVLGVNSKISSTQRIHNYSLKYNEPRVKCISDIIYGCLYIYYINQGKKKLKEKIQIKKHKILTLANKRSLEFELNPNDDYIILYKEDSNNNMQDDSSYQEYEITRETTFENSVLYIDDNSVGAFNSNVHNENLFLNEKDKNPKNPGKVDLIKILKENGKKSKRVYNNQEIDVCCYSILHENGVVLLYTNYTYFPYEENIIWELENLTIVNNNEDGVVRFQMEPYSEYFLFLDRIDKNKPYAFKTKCYYKYYPEK